MTPRRRGSSLFAFWIFVVLAFAAPRHALAGDDSLARAKVHFENGVHLYDQKPPDYEAALAEFRAAEKEHPSPGIKRNVALCLKAMHRYGEAIDELNAMLAAGDAVKPEAREAGKKMLAEIQALIATLRIKIVLHRVATQVAGEVPRVDIALDGVSVPAEKLAGPVATGPGDHVVNAHAQGYGDATKKISVVAGDKNVLVQLDLIPVAAGAGLGSLHVQSNVPKSQISIDGVALANGSWEGGLPAGHHHVEVASEGLPTWSRDIDVVNGQRVDLEATLGDTNAPPPPPPYGEGGTPMPKPAKEPERPWFLMGGLGLFTGTYKVAAGPFDEGTNTNHGFDGIALNVRAGRQLGKYLELEGFGEVGVAKPVAYNVRNETTPTPADVTLAYGQIGPEIRAHSRGNVRVIGGTGFALEFDSVTLANLDPVDKKQHKGSGVEGAWVIEGGMQFLLGTRIFLEGDIFLNVSGDGSVKDQDSKDRYFYDSPVTRGGLRLFFGLTL